MRAFSLLIVAMLASPAEALPLESYRHDKALAREAYAIAIRAAEAYLLRGASMTPTPTHPALKLPGGVFVTHAKDRLTRGCWGTVHPQRSTLAEEIAQAAVKALRYDYRHRPITKSEWPELETFVSLIGPLEPVSRPTVTEGLFVTARGRGGVLLPKEARTVRWQIAECRRKAGLTASEPVQMFRFETVVCGPEGER